MPVTKSNIGNYLNAYISPDYQGQGTDPRQTELNNEGFSDVMMISFVKAANRTKTIISSRTPGGAGLKLIDAGYDLKGFQIKSKSCDWRPMSGFLCQLPFLNKYGNEKISYNTGYIAHYLKCLRHFSGPKNQITAFNTDTARKTGVDNVITIINNLTANDITGDQLTTTINNINAPFANDVFNINDILPHDAIEAILDTEYDLPTKQQELKKVVWSYYFKPLRETIIIYQAQEHKSGEWSGENSIEDKLPFIHLRREFGALADVIATVKDMTGVVKDSVVMIGNDIYGVATSGADENPQNPTVFVEFLLRQQGQSVDKSGGTDTNPLWAIYHGQLLYINPDDGTKTTFTPGTGTPRPYAGLLKNDVINSYPVISSDKVTSTDAAENQDILDSIFSFAPGGPPAIKNVEVSTSPAPFTAGKRDFYPMMGFMNPHPPYKKVASGDKSVTTLVEGPDYYLNAVSGDFDLMAFWPNYGISDDELTRLSERYLYQNLKYYPTIDQQLCIEFIPGFGEINPNSDTPFLKESTETGNVSNLGNLVGGVLNSFSGTIYNSAYNRTITNKAFHSDEGGRPGVMEIEFPFPFFFPEKYTSTVFNNACGQGPIPALAGRTSITSYGGLVKTPEELLQLMLECTIDIQRDSATGHVESKYIVIMQAEWMVHLFYISMPSSDRQDFLSQSRTSFPDIFPGVNENDENGQPIQNDTDKLTKRNKTVTDKIAEFKKIEDHHNQIYGNPSSFDQPAFESNLTRLLQLSGDDDFKTVRNQFLILAFNNKQKALLRKQSIEYTFTAISAGLITQALN